MDAGSTSTNAAPQATTGEGTASEGTAARGELTVDPASSPRRSMPIKRSKSLPDLPSEARNQHPPPLKLHHLQRITRRRSFSDSHTEKPHFLGNLRACFPEDGIHSCSYCRNVNFHLSPPPQRSWRDPHTWRHRSHRRYLDVTYAEARHAAKGGCHLFLNMLGSYFDPRFDLGSRRLSFLDWFSLPWGHGASDAPTLDSPVAFSIKEHQERHSGKTNTTVQFTQLSKTETSSHWSHGAWSMVSLDGNNAISALSQPIQLKALPPLRPSESFDDIRSWMKTCNSQHGGCSRSRNEFRPKRLIHVNHESRHCTVALVSLETAVDYATLSYCWGDQPPSFKTTSDTLSSACTGLPIELLPQTIQDAIRVTREMGLQYIWVDSICIVQDDENDKTEQIAQMARIFGNSYVTIAATGASRSSDGFLSSVNPFRLGCKVSVTTSTGSTHSVALGKITHHRMQYEPLLRRAWTLQETLLAPRILSFESDHIHWYCRDASWGTCGFGEGSPEQRLRYGIDPGHTELRKKLKTMSHSKTLLDSHSSRLRKRQTQWNSSYWRSYVETYSHRSLTLQSDILRAISASAELFERYSNPGQYRAGLWEADFLTQLTWYTWSGNRRPGNLQVPSWSWIAVKGPVEWPNFLRHDCKQRTTCEVVSVNVQPVSPDAPFGDAIGEALKLKGRLKTAVWKNHDQLYQAGLSEDCDSGSEITGEVVEFYRDEEMSREEEPVYCLEIMPYQQLRFWDEGGVHHFIRRSYLAVALVLIHNPGTETYRRVGCLYGDIAFVTLESLGKWKDFGNRKWWLKGWEMKEVTIV